MNQTGGGPQSTSFSISFAFPMMSHKEAVFEVCLKIHLRVLPVNLSEDFEAMTSFGLSSFKDVALLVYVNLTLKKVIKKLSHYFGI